MKMQAIRNNVIVALGAAKSKSPGGIIIPDIAKEIQREGVVVSVGDGIRAENGAVVPMQVAVGDRVLFSYSAGTVIEHEKKKYLVMAEDEILAIMGDA